MKGKSLEAWKFITQPNFLLGVFSVIAELALLVFVAECIGQLKWVHYDDL
jgi:hypothetical protein